MKKLYFQWSFKPHSGNGTATCIKEIKGKKVKFTYECGNAYERFRIEIFDGLKLNIVGSMRDIGGIPDTGTYICTDQEIRSRYDNLQINADTYIKTILN